MFKREYIGPHLEDRHFRSPYARKLKVRERLTPEELKLRRRVSNTSEAHRRSAYRHYLKKTYGISVDDRNRMVREQKGLCAVCFKPFRSSSFMDCYVDHDHRTGKVRGLVHPGCNVFLGHLEAFMAKGLLGNVLAYLGKGVLKPLDS